MAKTSDAKNKPLPRARSHEDIIFRGLYNSERHSGFVFDCFDCFDFDKVAAFSARVSPLGFFLIINPDSDTYPDPGFLVNPDPAPGPGFE